MEDPRLFLTALTVVPQLLLFGTDSLGGVSGQDSIIRSSIAALDLSAGLLFLNGTYQLIFEPGNDSYLRIPRWHMLHSGYHRKFSNRMKITTRTRWLPIFALSQRSATILSGNVDQDFVANSNQFFVPYMQYRDRKIPSSPLEVQLTRETVHRAAALSVARYFILFATTTIILVIRSILLWTFTPTLALRIIILLSLIGRWVMVVTQTASVLTYSCQYKAVRTWFSPSVTGPFWDPSTQKNFRALIWENMSYMWHAKIVFCIVERTVVAVTGRPFFSDFQGPAETEYESENGATDLSLLVYDDDVSPVIPKYTIRFCNTPRTVLVGFRRALFATLEQKLLFGFPALALGLFGAVAPVLFALFNPPDPKAKYFWVVEQIVVALVKYYDWDDLGINTTFGRGVSLTLEHESGRITRVSDDRSMITAGPSTARENSAASAVEADIAEIESYGMKASHLKALIAWAEISDDQEGVHPNNLEITVDPNGSQ